MVDSIRSIFYKRIWLNKKIYILTFLFISFIFIAEKNFIGIPKKAILFLSVIVFIILFLWNKDIEKNILVISLIFGGTFSLLTPVFEVWDEPAHYTRVQYISEGHLTISNDKDTHTISKDISKLEEISRYTSRKKSILPNTFEVSLWNYQHNPDKEYQFRVPVTNAYGTIAYLPAVVGFNLGKLISRGNLGTMFYLGRIFNAIFYSLCAYMAVKISKKWKHIMAFFALQPLAIYISGSYNQDAVSYGIILLVVAMFFRIIQEDESKVSIQFIISFVGLCMILAFTKLPYVTLAGLIFFIPYKKYKSRIEYGVMLLGMVLVILVSGLWFLYYSDITGLAPLSDKVDSAQQVSFIIQNPKQFISILGTNIFDSLTKYRQLSAFAWDQQGSHMLSLVNLISIGVILAFPMKNFERISTWTKIGIVIISGMILSLIYLSMYLTWTDVGANHISGVQGRYFFGIILLSPLIFNFSKYIGNIESNWFTQNTPQIMSLMLLIWSLASRIGIYY